MTKASPRKTLNVRNIDKDLWQRVHNHLERTGQKKYAFVEQALREKLERDELK